VEQYLKNAADIGDALPLTEELVRSAQLADDCLELVALGCHGARHGHVWATRKLS